MALRGFYNDHSAKPPRSSDVDPKPLRKILSTGAPVQQLLRDEVDFRVPQNVSGYTVARIACEEVLKIVDNVDPEQRTNLQTAALLAVNRYLSNN